MMTWEQKKNFNQTRGKAFVCETCALKKRGLCNNGPTKFCDFNYYIPTLEFIDFVMTTLTNGSSDEAEI